MDSTTGLPVVVDSTAPLPPFKVLVVGGSYGGLSAALNIQDLCCGKAPRCGEPPKEGEPPLEKFQVAVDITVVDERDGFYHLIGTPLALADEKYAEKAWVRYEDIAALRPPRSSSRENIRVLQGSVTSIDTERKSATFVAQDDKQSSELEYDYLVAASGLRRAWPAAPQSQRKKQFLSEAAGHIRTSKAATHGVVVVGGGAVGIEIAAELKTVHPHLKVTLVHSRDTLLSSEPLPDEVKARSLQLLQESGVETLLSHRLLSATPESTPSPQGTPKHAIRLHFTNSHTLLTSKLITAISSPIPSTKFLPLSALTSLGYVHIQPTLTFSNTPCHFAVGDIVHWSGIKRCGGAMHMGYLAAHNIHQLMRQRLNGSEPVFKKLDEIPPMIGLAVGKSAVAYWPEGGMTSGEDVLKAFFGDDLGFSICWSHLQLGWSKGEVVTDAAAEVAPEVSPEFVSEVVPEVVAKA
ncbi:apoptosis-inducing factor 2 [Podospora aff. communis PSN243]|uniref:Apoptosis-inducing factor 2 n=1 Tax=Podospora aff. communis PSN243 TaxID=3040156 RepID=A0AAV9GD46_9PEZI|nr:apoptosis-inducing factor 2 [Podospora aff. communis PSN243]